MAMATFLQTEEELRLAWRDARGRGVLTPWTFNGFVTSLIEGMERARSMLLNSQTHTAPGAELLREAHHAMFNGVSSDSGRLRHGNEIATNEFGKAPSWDKVTSEIENFSRDAHALLKSDSIRDKCDGIALFVAALAAIEPFPAGNRELRHVVLITMIERTFGKAEFSQDIPLDQLDRAIAYSIEGKPKVLSDLIADVTGQGDKMRLNEIDRQLAMANDLKNAPAIAH